MINDKYRNSMCLSLDNKYILKDFKTTNHNIQQKSHQRFHIIPQTVFLWNFLQTKKKYTHFLKNSH